MKLPLAMRFRGGASASERGPSARRGMQFAEAELPELLERLAKARQVLRQIDALRAPAHENDDELRALQALSREELEALRRRNVALQTDLRAELRRRGAY